MSIIPTFVAVALGVLLPLTGLTQAAPPPTTQPLNARQTLEHAILGEEVAWLKLAGWDQYLPPAGYYESLKQPLARRGASVLPLVRMEATPKVDGVLNDATWGQVSRGPVHIALPLRYEDGPLLTMSISAYRTAESLVVAIEADRPVMGTTPLVARIEAFAAENAEHQCVELAVGPAGATARTYTYQGWWGWPKKKLGATTPVAGAVDAERRRVEAVIPISLFPAGLNGTVMVLPDLFGLYEMVHNSPFKETDYHSRNLKPAELRRWKRIEFRPDSIAIRQELIDVKGQLALTIRNHGKQAVQLTIDSKADSPVVVPPGETQVINGGQAGSVGRQWTAAIRSGDRAYTVNLLNYDPLPRAMEEFEAMIALRQSQGVNTADGKAAASRLRAEVARASDAARARQLLFDIRQAKRDLFFTHPDHKNLTEILFLKRHALYPSHNYTEFHDGHGGLPGGGIHVLAAPFENGRLRVDAARVHTLFDAGLGMARTPAVDCDAKTIYFAYLPPDAKLGNKLRPKDGFMRLMAMDRDGGDVRQLTDGRFQDFWPTPLPDGGLAFISTRAKSRFYCFSSAAYTLFRMEADGSGIRPLSPNNLSEWSPSLLGDGRIAWSRSEYQDKGALFGHTLWAVRPDGSHPELLFGNNTPGAYFYPRQVPGTGEVVCVLGGHTGDLCGPIALIRGGHDPSDARALLNLTPDVEGPVGGTMPFFEAFREPYPISKDLILCSHAPAGRFGLYVIDRFGNREILHMDPAIESLIPSPLRPVARPPVVSSALDQRLAARNRGVFFVANVYEGLGDSTAAGEAKYIQVFHEVKHDLRTLPDGCYQVNYPNYDDWYATPVHRTVLPGKPWPAYIAKASPGLTPVNADGSAAFEAPAERMLYFSLLDEKFNEIQRMRSIVHLMPGERRGCIGCHESRSSTTSQRMSEAMAQPPRELTPMPWGEGAFSYLRDVQPVLDRHCVKCHDGREKDRPDLRGDLNALAVPQSYRSMVNGGLVHYADTRFPTRHAKFAPKSLGAVKSRLAALLDAGHEKVSLSRDERLAIKTWIAMNCPLHGDYRPPAERLAELRTQANTNNEKAP